MMKMDPRQMAALARQMGIVSNEIKSKRVIIEKSDGGKLIIDNPTVMAMDMGGQKNYTIMGSEREEKAGASKEEGTDEEETEDNESPESSGSEEETEGEISEKDIAMVAEQAKVSKETAKKALEEANGDIAEAIMKLEK